MPKILPRIPETALDLPPPHPPQRFFPWGKRPAPPPRSPSPELKGLSPPSYHRKRRLSDAFVDQPSPPTPTPPPPAPPHPDQDPRPAVWENPIAQSTPHEETSVRMSTAERRRGMLPIPRDKISS